MIKPGAFQEDKRLLEFADKKFQQFNSRYFGGRLPVVLFAALYEDGAHAVYTRRPYHGVDFGHIHLNPELLEDNIEEVVARVILHEMIHHAAYENGARHGSEAHSNSEWLAEVERVASVLGVPVPKDTSTFPISANVTVS